jgi:hypothetical protein
LTSATVIHTYADVSDNASRIRPLPISPYLLSPYPWTQGFVEAFLKTIDCYVMGSRTYETALGFETRGSGWAYGDKPTFVPTSRELPRTRDTVEFHSGDLAQFVNGCLRPTFRSIWFVERALLNHFQYK